MKTWLNQVISQQATDVFDLYTELHGARISLFGPDKELLYPDSRSRPDCDYCQMLRGPLGLNKTCRQLDRDMMRSALEKKEMVSYSCHAGMREAAAPLFVENQLVGFVMIGQFRSQSAPEVSPYADQWKTQQGDNALQEAFAASTVFPDEKIDALLAMFRQMLELIIRSHLIRHKDYDLIQPVIVHLEQHPEVHLSLSEVASLIGRSSSTVSRLFKKLTGRSFKQYQVDFWMQQATEQLESRPNRPVAEIARNLGFDDPFYFSRLFHKHIGLSPTEYRHQEDRSARMR